MVLGWVQRRWVSYSDMRLNAAGVVDVVVELFHGPQAILRRRALADLEMQWKREKEEEGERKRESDGRSIAARAPCLIARRRWSSSARNYHNSPRQSLVLVSVLLSLSDGGDTAKAKESKEIERTEVDVGGGRTLCILITHAEASWRERATLDALNIRHIYICIL